MKSSFEVFRSTIEKLSVSQGYYTHLRNQIENMSQEELNTLEYMINTTKNYKDSIDVVMDLEG